MNRLLVAFLVFFFSYLFVIGGCKEEQQPPASPELGIYYPTDALHVLVGSLPLTIKGTVSGDNVVEIKVFVDGRSYSIMPTPEWELSLNPSILYPGRHDIKAYAVSGNGVYSSQVNLSFYVDKLYLELPVASSVYPIGSAIEVRGKYYGDSDETPYVKVVLDPEDTVSITVTAGLDSSNSFYAEILTATMSRGLHVIKVEGGGYEVSRDIIIADPPSIGLTYPDSFHVGYSEPLIIEGTLAGDLIEGVEVNVDGSVYEAEIGSGTWSLSLSSLRAGLHNVYAEVRTSYGATAYVSSSFSLDDVKIVSPEDGGIYIEGDEVLIKGTVGGYGIESTSVKLVIGVSEYEVEVLDGVWQYEVGFSSAGTYNVVAVADIGGIEVTSNEISLEVGISPSVGIVDPEDGVCYISLDATDDVIDVVGTVSGSSLDVVELYVDGSLYAEVDINSGSWSKDLRLRDIVDLQGTHEIKARVRRVDGRHSGFSSVEIGLEASARFEAPSELVYDYWSVPSDYVRVNIPVDLNPGSSCRLEMTAYGMSIVGATNELEIALTANDNFAPIYVPVEYTASPSSGSEVIGSIDPITSTYLLPSKLMNIRGTQSYRADIVIDKNGQTLYAITYDDPNDRIYTYFYDLLTGTLKGTRYINAPSFDTWKLHTALPDEDKVIVMLVDANNDYFWGFKITQDSYSYEKLGECSTGYAVSIDGDYLGPDRYLYTFKCQYSSFTSGTSYVYVGLWDGASTSVNNSDLSPGRYASYPRIAVSSIDEFYVAMISGDSASDDNKKLYILKFNGIGFYSINGFIVGKDVYEVDLVLTRDYVAVVYGADTALKISVFSRPDLDYLYTDIIYSEGGNKAPSKVELVRDNIIAVSTPDIEQGLLLSLYDLDTQQTILSRVIIPDPLSYYNWTSDTRISYPALAVSPIDLRTIYVGITAVGAYPGAQSDSASFVGKAVKVPETIF